VKEQPKLFTADDLERLLGNRYPSPEWAFIPQVRSGTGYRETTRTADALAMGLWPSRGLYLHGFEIKVQRGDWIKELKNPAKAEELAQFCDFWWLVAPQDIIKPEEIPSTWGLMVPFGETTKIIKQAQQLTPKPINKSFFAALLRRAQEIVTPEAKLKASFEEGKIKGREDFKQEFEYATRDHKELQQALLIFEKKSGISINKWSDKNIGDAVRRVLNGEHLRIKDSLRNLLDQSKRITERIEEELKKNE
jgi:hypothetical protein